MKKQIITLIFLILLSLVFVSSVQALVINSVSTVPGQIAPGETSNIRLGLENNGEGDIEDLSVALDLSDVPFAPYASASEFDIDVIKEGKTKYAEFKIIALNNAESGIYKIPLKISYYDENREKATKESLISITVNSEPIIGISLEDGLLLKGTENEIQVKIVNKGLSNVRFLEVEAKGGTYYSVLSQKNVYIGDIDSDDFDSVNFKIYFKENAPSTIKLPITVFYKDAVNNEYKEEFSLSLKVYSQEEAIRLGLLKKSNTITYVIVIVVLIVIYIVYRNIKKRIKLKKAKAA